MSAAALRYVPRPDPDPSLRDRILALAHRHRRYGAGMIYLKLRQEGRRVNHKRVDWLYAEARLQVRRRRRKKVPLADRQPLVRPQAPNEVWSVDFVFDRTAEGRVLKCQLSVAVPTVSDRQACRCGGRGGSPDESPANPFVRNLQSPGSGSNFGFLRLLRRHVSRLRTEGAGSAREAAAVGVGAFIGCQPFYGFHLALCWGIGWLLRLNRLKVYLAANISNPILAPFLIVAEVQVGAWLNRGSTHELTIAAARGTDPWIFGSDLLIGSLAVGTVLGILGAVFTYSVTRSQDPFFVELVERAADRYLGQSLLAWEYGRSKLLRDPIYRTLVCDGVMPSGGTLVDVGCGQGLMLALLVAAADIQEDEWPSNRPVPPRFDRLIGIELRPRVARLAHEALGDCAEISGADANSAALTHFDVALIVDVLHMMPAAAQVELVERLKTCLAPNGLILIREADASAGWRFAIVRSVNWLQAARQGNWRVPFHFRGRDGWLALMSECGLVAEVVEQDGVGRLGNLLFRARLP